MDFKGVWSELSLALFFNKKKNAYMRDVRELGRTPSGLFGPTVSFVLHRVGADR